MTTQVNTNSRRAILAGVAVLSIAAATKVAPASAETGTDDLIFTALAKHKAAVEAYREACRRNWTLEEEIPHHLRRTFICKYECRIVETDDPRWIESEKRVLSTSDGMDDAAEAILAIELKTLQGAAAALKYMVDHMDDHDGKTMGWPDHLYPDNVDPETVKPNASRSAEYFLMKNVAACLERLGASAS